ncbi:MAG: FAD-binding oxidoreductase [Acidimicrobiia bacterium]
MQNPYLESESLSIPKLREVIRGEVIAPDDVTYDQARAVYYGIDRRPAVIIRPTDAEEVAYVVAVARDTGIELAVRSGGHSLSGHGVSEDGIVLDLSGMKGLHIDATQRTVWAQSGLTAGELTKAVGEHGLAVGFGDAGSVGIGGITLGGGVGFLVRKLGLTIDSLLAAEVVTADGRLIDVDAENHPDLFWAIRGGGGNFGVVTRFKFGLAEVGEVFGGMLMLPATSEVIKSFVDLAEAAPEELSGIANVMLAPPMPFLPEEQHGKPVLFGIMVYAGDPSEGEEVLAPFRTLATPLMDMLQPMSYPEIYEQLEEGGAPTPAGFVVRTMFLDGFDQDAAAAIVDRLNASTANMAVAQLRVLGGAMARIPDDATAFAHRGHKLMANVAAMYEDSSQAAVHEAWVDELAGLIDRGGGGAYVNFLGDEGADRIRAAYPGPTWDRLRAIKRRYDPTNLFRVNQNIPPAR